MAIVIYVLPAWPLRIIYTRVVLISTRYKAPPRWPQGATGHLQAGVCLRSDQFSITSLTVPSLLSLATMICTINVRLPTSIPVTWPRTKDTPVPRRMSAMGRRATG